MDGDFCFSIQKNRKIAQGYCIKCLECYNGVRNKIFIASLGLRKFAEIYEVFSIPIIPKDSVLTH